MYSSTALFFWRKDIRFGCDDEALLSGRVLLTPLPLVLVVVGVRLFGCAGSFWMIFGFGSFALRFLSSTALLNGNETTF